VVIPPVEKSKRQERRSGTTLATVQGERESRFAKAQQDHQPAAKLKIEKVHMEARERERMDTITIEPV
jgi:hypothetical protein